MELIQTRNRPCALSSEHAVFQSDTPDQGLFTLTIHDAFTVESIPATLGEYVETLALPARRRPHVAADGSELSFEANSSIPFESEPGIERTYRMGENSLFCSGNFVLRNSFPLRHIDAGGLRITGKIVSYAGIRLPETCGVIPSPEGIPLPETDTILYDEPVPPLRFDLIAENGVRLVFQLGADYWRWINAAAISGSARYRILLKDGEIRFTWNLYDFSGANEEVPPPGRNWRTSWLLHWGEPDCMPTTPLAVFDLNEAAFSEFSQCDGNHVCLCSDRAVAILKKWVRSHLATIQNGDTLAITSADAHFCRRAGHLDRAKKNDLPHSDAIAMFEFKRWANRQLGASGAKLVMIESSNP